jgi:hypothetical protein
MSTPENILAKVKLLLNLANSSNPNEAENAKAMADKLVSKYNISPEELESLKDKKPLYGEDEKLFITIGLVSWRQRLALAIGKHFYCQIVQEELVPTEGLHQFNYFVYGEPEDVVTVKFVFATFVKKVEELIEKKCVGRGPIFVSSYSEGVVESISNNIYWEGIDIPDVKKPSRPLTTEAPVLNNGDSNLAKHKEDKEPVVDKTVDVNTQSLIKDVAAYFKGLEDGKNFSLNEILELEVENERLKELEEPDDKTNST